ncbi:MAG: DUF4157 domain-containing protein [bacterium]|nr:DUF4157 domain-containing protein [bacterium]
MVNNSPQAVRSAQTQAMLNSQPSRVPSALSPFSLAPSQPPATVPHQQVTVPGREPVQREAEENRTGMPDRLKAGLEGLSGLDLSWVRVHYNSPKPAQLAALAYTQGQDIHVGPGQERHLPHEGWHAVQQMEGRVRPTLQAYGLGINDDVGLEREADVMAGRALQMRRPDPPATRAAARLGPNLLGTTGLGTAVVQRVIGDNIPRGSLVKRNADDETFMIRTFYPATGQYVLENTTTRSQITVQYDDAAYDLQPTPIRDALAAWLDGNFDQDIKPIIENADFSQQIYISRNTYKLRFRQGPAPTRNLGIDLHWDGALGSIWVEGMEKGSSVFPDTLQNNGAAIQAAARARLNLTPPDAFVRQPLNNYRVFPLFPPNFYEVRCLPARNTGQAQENTSTIKNYSDRSGFISAPAGGRDIYFDSVLLTGRRPSPGARVVYGLPLEGRQGNKTPWVFVT